MICLSLTTYNSQLLGPGRPKALALAQTEAKLETYRSNLTAILMTSEVS